MASRPGGWLYPALAAVAGVFLLFPPLVLTRQDLVRTRAELAYARRDAESGAAPLVRLESAGISIARPSQPVAFEVETGPGPSILYLESGGSQVARRAVAAGPDGRVVFIITPRLLPAGTYLVRVESAGARRQFPVHVE
jgi:hypothetical protein